jgi:hypothetical protein
MGQWEEEKGKILVLIGSKCGWIGCNSIWNDLGQNFDNIWKEMMNIHRHATPK